MSTIYYSRPLLDIWLFNNKDKTECMGEGDMLERISQSLCCRIIECPPMQWVNYKRFPLSCLITDRFTLNHSIMISICFSSVGPACQLIFRFLFSLM